MDDTRKLKVFLVGVGGRTGRMLMERLGNHPEFLVKGSDAVQPELLRQLMQGSDRLVMLASATPKMVPATNPSDPAEWYFEPGQDPEKVDWEGARCQIDIAKALNFRHVILISSMGVVRHDHPFNQQYGKILMWKRMAEEYLMNSARHSTTYYTGLTYTIIHTGGLTDNTPPLHNELVIGHGDDHLEDAHGKPLNRADLALVIEQALLNPESYDKNFDLYSVPHRGKPSPIDFAEFFSRA